MIENLFRLLRLTDLEDQTLSFELHALLRHGLPEVVNLHDTEAIRLDGSLQSRRGFTQRFDRGYLDQHKSYIPPSVHNSEQARTCG